MGCGIKAMWDDADEYAFLAKKYNVPVKLDRPGGMWPYHMDDKHYYQLKERWRKEDK